MYSTLPLAHTGYTLHVMTTSARTHVARLLRPDGCVVSEWMTTCGPLMLKGQIKRLRESIEESLGDKATLPVYYGTASVPAMPAPTASALHLSSR